MTPADVFVGMVAIGLGVLGLVAAIGNWEGCFRIRKARMVEQLAGRRTARCTYCIIGVGLIVLGFAIARGFAPNRTLLLFTKSHPGFATQAP